VKLVDQSIFLSHTQIFKERFWKRPEINIRLRAKECSFLSFRTDDGGGAKRDRTADLLRARQALSQLSYGPVFYYRPLPLEIGGSGQIRTADLTLIRGAL
jgi:hypothetical protein